jgi:hypothetical protein
VPEPNLTMSQRNLNELYAKVRAIRDARAETAEARRGLDEVHAALEAEHPTDWLLRFELLELDSDWRLGAAWAARARARLVEIGNAAPDKAEMIARGLALLGKKAG